MTSKSSILPIAAICVCLLSVIAQGHAFLDHADPKVGSVISTPPTVVKIWFTEEIEPAFSTMKVLDAGGKQVDSGDVHVDAKDKTLLSVSLPALPAGEYRVFWAVVASDTHKTHGDFKFTVKP